MDPRGWEYDLQSVSTERGPEGASLMRHLGLHGIPGVLPIARHTLVRGTPIPSAPRTLLNSVLKV